MIADHIDFAERYYCLGKRFEEAFQYLKQTDFSSVPLEKQLIRGEELFALPQTYPTKLRDAGRWEAHRRYADIQYIVRGRERMGVAKLADMRVTEEYNVEKDVAFFEGSGQFLTYEKGDFAIFLPHDAHMPGIAVEWPDTVLKVVMKVSLE